jgi:hypothetical protein
MPPHRIVWLEEAKADVRALDRPTAMRIFEGVLHFARTGSGDVKTLHGDLAGAFRLRLGAIAPKPTAEITFRDHPDSPAASSSGASGCSLPWPHL